MQVGCVGRLEVRERQVPINRIGSGTLAPQDGVSNQVLAGATAAWQCSEEPRFLLDKWIQYAQASRRRRDHAVRKHKLFARRGYGIEAGLYSCYDR
jgi:hypothetical protein